MRLKAVEAAEAAAAAAAAPAAPVDPKAKGGKDKGGGGAVAGHNNDAGFARRFDVYNKTKAEAAEDLQARVRETFGRGARGRQQLDRC